MSEKIILITGSTDGIGYQAAIELGDLGHHVIVHGRNQEKAKLAMETIGEETNNVDLSYVHADLVSIDQINNIDHIFYLIY